MFACILAICRPQSVVRCVCQFSVRRKYPDRVTGDNLLIKWNYRSYHLSPLNGSHSAYRVSRAALTAGLNVVRHELPLIVRRIATQQLRTSDDGYAESCPAALPFIRLGEHYGERERELGVVGRYTDPRENERERCIVHQLPDLAMSTVERHPVVQGYYCL